VKTPIKVSAPEYVDFLMSWVETQLNDEHIFPLQLGALCNRAFCFRLA
jgi:MOB kinase activator 1